MRLLSSITIGLLLLFAVFLFSCENESLVFKGPYFVRFTDTSVTQKESYSKPVQIEVHLAGAAQESDVTLNYSISGTAREGIDYTVLGTRGQVTIKKGEYFGYIEVQLINNSNNILRSQDIVFTLLTINDNGIQVGQGVSAIGQAFTFTIQDDCILGGFYYGVRGALSLPVEDITITSSNCVEYTLSNWDINIFSFPQIRSLTFIDNADNTLTIPEQDDPTLADGTNTIKGTGIINPVTRQITITLILVDYEGQPQFTFNLIAD